MTRKKLLTVVFSTVAIIAVALVGVELIAYQNYQSQAGPENDTALYQQIIASQHDTATKTTKVTSTTHTQSQASTSRTKLQQSAETDLQTMIVAGGCFWCVEADMEKAPGVIAALSGYSGGETANPTYENYADGGHREVVQVIYDANTITRKGLLYYFIKHIDPTDGSGSFVDRGVEYSPAIYYQNIEEMQAAEAVLADIESRGVFSDPLQVPVLPRQDFYLAENYHQDSYKKSVVRYRTYRRYSGRDNFIKKHWGYKTADNIPDNQLLR